MASSKVKNYFYDDMAVRFGTAGTDKISTSNSLLDVVSAGGGNDRITASNGGDLVFGQSGNDVLVIGKGLHDDITFEGGSGRDVVDLSWFDPKKEHFEFAMYGDVFKLEYHGHDWFFIDVEAVKVKSDTWDI